jgi:hypothetical protein
MIVREEDFHKLKHPEEFKYRVFHVHPRHSCYDGTGIVAAETPEKANEFIEAFRNIDRDNRQDSLGWSNVNGNFDFFHEYSDEEGILNYGIQYKG